MTQPVGILLAAGRSSRFGADKLLHPMPDGTPMAAVAARTMVEALGTRVVAVVRREGPLAEALRRAGAETLPCPTADGGLGCSLSWGVGATQAADGWVIGLGDMPFVTCATIRSVACALAEGAALAAPVLPDGRRGHPVGFAAEWRDALAALSGDRGAGHLLLRYQDRLRRCLTLDEGCVRDVDAPADLHR